MNRLAVYGDAFPHELEAYLHAGHGMGSLILYEPVSATPESGRLEATTWPGPRRGPYVRLRLTDNGIGMSSEVREQAFEPFFTTKPHGRGTGLGLATGATIVSGWGGQTRIDSAPGLGTTCTVLIPGTGEAPPQTFKEADHPG